MEDLLLFQIPEKKEALGTPNHVISVTHID